MTHNIADSSGSDSDSDDELKKKAKSVADGEMQDEEEKAPSPPPKPKDPIKVNLQLPAVPRIKPTETVFTSRMPNFLGVQVKPFDEDSYDPADDEIQEEEPGSPRGAGHMKTPRNMIAGEQPGEL